jgi:hypothetical protein
MADEHRMTLVKAEDLDAALRRILEEAREVGREAENAALRGGEEIRRVATKPDISERLLDELKSALYDEVVVAKPAAGETVIEQREEEREIAKRALAHIRLPRLRVIAEDLGLDKHGTLDEVADRIVRQFKSDREKIAELVVRYEEEPPPERRFATRVFQLRDAPEDQDAVAKRTQLFTNRYIRTGIARWFVINAVERLAGLLRMEGTFRYYSADATLEDQTYNLVAVPGAAQADLTLHGRDPMVEVEAKGTTESRALMTAFQHASGLRWRDSFSLAQLPVAEEVRHWDPRSVFMVAFLHARLLSDAVEIRNLTSAGFQTATTPSEEDQAARPVVRSVRFQGRHLLDSRAACELLVRGQGLVELGMVVRFKPNIEEAFVMPVTLRLERDHVTVMTGFGLQPPNAARLLHTELLAGVRKALRDGLADVKGFRNLAQEIRQRAEQDEPVARATFFGVAETELAE